MANAQVLIAVRSPAEIQADVFQVSVAEAAREAGLGLGRWTYDATPVTVSSDGAVETVRGGPWDGITFSTHDRAGDRRVVISSFRQNLTGLPSTALEADARLQRLMASVGGILTARGVPTTRRTAFRTTRNLVSWDRGIPAAIDLSADGAGPGMGLLAVLGVAGLIGYTYTKGRI